MPAFAPTLSPPSARSVKIGRFRWTICGLLFAVSSLNYLDRQVFGILAPELIKLFGWSRGEYADMVFWFEAAYAAGFLGAGWFLDRVGTRLGFALAAAAWSAGAMLHAAVGTVLGFKIMRALLGFAEPAHLPAAIKAVAEWFPRRERALATGLYKAGGNIGAITASLLVPWLFVRHGWRWAFLLTGALGFVWLVFWLWLYRRPEESPRVGPVERALIRSDPPGESRSAVPWRVLLRHRETWAYVQAKFLTDAIWHWYLYMLPLFISSEFHLSIKQFGLPLVVVYVIADAGSIGGGWFSSHLMHRGWAVTPARMLAMLVCCCLVLPAVFVPHVRSVWTAVVIVGVASAAHQGFTSNLFTTVSDLYPQRAVGSIVGLGGTAGMIGAALLALFTAWLLQGRGAAGYTVIFFLAGTVYLVALALFRLLAPTLEPIRLRA